MTFFIKSMVLFHYYLVYIEIEYNIGLGYISISTKMDILSMGSSNFVMEKWSFWGVFCPSATYKAYFLPSNDLKTLQPREKV